MARKEMLAIASASLIEPYNNKKPSRMIATAKWLMILLLVSVLISIFLVEVNHWRTSYTVLSSGSGEDIVYIHEDERTNDIVKYLTGEGEFPKEERLPVYRQYVKNML